MIPLKSEHTLRSPFLNRGTTTPVCQSSGSVPGCHTMLQVLRADLIHPWCLATEELLGYLSDVSLSKTELTESTSESPSSASSMEGVSVALRRSSKYSFHRPTMSPVEVNSSPPQL